MPPLLPKLIRVGLTDQNHEPGRPVPEIDHNSDENIKLTFKGISVRFRKRYSKCKLVVVVVSKKTLTQLGRAEVEMKSQDPPGKSAIVVPYNWCKEIPDLKFLVHVVPSNPSKLTKKKFMGEATCNLLEIVEREGRDVVLVLQSVPAGRKVKRRRMLTIHVERVL